jgi:hypothetical protein
MSIETDKSPRDMSLADIKDCCWSEINKFSHQEAHDDRYCLELFRRALVLRDARAWELLMQRFNGMVVSWLRRHPSHDAAYRLNSEENYAALAFERFWMVTVRNKSLEFVTLAGALSFLRACLNSVIIDTLRGQMKEMPFPEVGFDEPITPEYDDGLELWESIQGLLPSERERRLAYLLYHCGLKPRQIVQYCPQEFDDVQEIFRMTRNILDRLRRNKDRLRWLLDIDT